MCHLSLLQDKAYSVRCVAIGCSDFFWKWLFLRDSRSFERPALTHLLPTWSHCRIQRRAPKTLVAFVALKQLRDAVNYWGHANESYKMIICLSRRAWYLLGLLTSNYFELWEVAPCSENQPIFNLYLSIPLNPFLLKLLLFPSLLYSITPDIRFPTAILYKESTRQGFRTLNS